MIVSNKRAAELAKAAGIKPLKMMTILSFARFATSDDDFCKRLVSIKKHWPMWFDQLNSRGQRSSRRSFR